MNKPVAVDVKSDLLTFKRTLCVSGDIGARSHRSSSCLLDPYPSGMEPKVLSNVMLLPIVRDVCNEVQIPKNNQYAEGDGRPGRSGGCGSKEAAKARSQRPRVFPDNRWSHSDAGLHSSSSELEPTAFCRWRKNEGAMPAQAAQRP